MKRIKFTLLLVLLHFSTYAQLSKIIAPKWTNSSTKMHYKLGYLEGGLQYALGKKIGIRFGADFLITNNTKSKIRKNKKAKSKNIINYLATNFTYTNASASYNSLALDCNLMHRKIKAKGFTSQCGIGLGIQRNQYTGTREPGTISGRTYGLVDATIGLGYSFNKKWSGSSLLLSVRKNYLFHTNFKLGGSNTLFELSFIKPLKLKK